ncbi:MAG TPA: M48 family metallopeptidase [Longimicrobiaceae bacterium]|nr:M48 family metallopeptidase [Longimicrobiaceae bacterium]
MNVTMWQLRRSFTALTLAAGVATLGGCASAAQITTQQEVQLGAQEAAEINQQLPLIQDATVNYYVNQLGKSIAQRADPRGIPYTFRVVNSDAVNAFSIPGGYVYVNRGLIERASNMSELAGVLAHEIGHVVERHGIEQLASAQNASTKLTLGQVVAAVLLGGQAAQAVGTVGQVVGTAVLASYSRKDEQEADLDAIPYLIATGIDPRGLVTMFETLIRMEQTNPSAVAQWFSTHPLTQDRINYVQQAIDQYPTSQLNQLAVHDQNFVDVKQRLLRMPPAPRAR